MKRDVNLCKQIHMHLLHLLKYNLVALTVHTVQCGLNALSIKFNMNNLGKMHLLPTKNYIKMKGL